MTGPKFEGVMKEHRDTEQVNVISNDEAKIELPDHCHGLKVSFVDNAGEFLFGLSGEVVNQQVVFVRGTTDANGGGLHLTPSRRLRPVPSKDIPCHANPHSMPQALPCCWP